MPSARKPVNRDREARSNPVKPAGKGSTISIFKAYDIRGLYGEEMDENTAEQIGRAFVLTPGVSYQVADGAEPHLSSTTHGARLFIVD